MTKSKLADWIFRTVVLASVVGLAYPLCTNIADQADINTVFDEASLSVKDQCVSQTDYSRLASYFQRDMRDSYHKCIAGSNDEKFKAAAAKYILERLSKNGETDALKELKSAIDG